MLPPPAGLRSKLLHDDEALQRNWGLQSNLKEKRSEIINNTQQKMDDLSGPCDPVPSYFSGSNQNY